MPKLRLLATSKGPGSDPFKQNSLDPVFVVLSLYLYLPHYSSAICDRKQEERNSVFLIPVSWLFPTEVKQM